MRRPLSNALADRPLFFEATPPAARAPARRGQEHFEKVAELVRGLPRVDLIDVPELVDENHEGRPFYRSGDIRDYAGALQTATACPLAINKVVAHLDSPPALEAWARETAARGILNVVLVGGSSRYIPYPGPGVIEADRVCLPVLQAAGGRIGNIAIPQRAGEAHRLLAKTRAGASFFTTQILFESASALGTILEYDSLCRRAGIAPAAILLSFAPMIDEGDAEFVRWLGADIPEEAEREILSGDEGAGTSRSVEHSLRMWEEVRAGLGTGGSEVSIGVNVEEIMPKHLEAAAEMLRRFARAMDSLRPIHGSS
jgi:5,10-methylenetetrahydrofolate reductase